MFPAATLYPLAPHQHTHLFERSTRGLSHNYLLFIARMEIFEKHAAFWPFGLLLVITITTSVNIDI